MHLKNDLGLADYFMEMGYFESQDGAKRALAQLEPLDPGKLKGLVMMPLDKTSTMQPDLVWIYGTPTQMARLAAGWVYKTGELIDSNTTGIGICYCRWFGLGLICLVALSICQCRIIYRIYNAK